MSETKTKNLCTVPAADLTDNQYFIAEDGGELKRIPKAQVVLKKLENMLATDTENLAGGGEVTAQELLDVLAEQVANKLLAKSQVVNNLLATVEGNPLDATQGKALKDLIDTTNNNLSKCLQYIHSETDVFDFNDPKTPAGYHRLGAAASYKNAPSGLDGVNFCTVEVVRPTISDTLAMTIYPYKKGINPPVWYKSGGSNEWSTLPWNVYATKSDLLNFKTFQISIKTNTVKDGESQMYHGNVKISDNKNCPPNTVCIIPYGARLETDASRAGIISYRATDTFCAVSHPTISNKNFIVTVLAIYKS